MSQVWFCSTDSSCLSLLVQAWIFNLKNPLRFSSLSTLAVVPVWAIKLLRFYSSAGTCAARSPGDAPRQRMYLCGILKAVINNLLELAVSTVGFLLLYTHSIFSVCLVWTGRITFADFGDFFVSGWRCWNLDVFHEYLRVFCITDRSTLPQQTPQGFTFLCRGQVLSWAKLTFWQLIELMVLLCTPLPAQLMQHTTATCNVLIHQNLNCTNLWCFL